MSQKLNNTPHNVPFFPPGIAHHKNVSTLDFGSKRPISVKECKMLSKPKTNIMTSSLIDPKERQNNLRRFSKSTPDLNVCQNPNQDFSFSQHNCDMGLSTHSDMKANPVPSYFISDYLEKPSLSYNSLTEKTKSLDRLSSTSKPRNLTGFVPDRPFYPPSKYPNIHDKMNANLQRLIDARNQYKTPESRKSIQRVTRQKSMSNIEKCVDENLNLNKNPHYSSVPDLKVKTKPQTPKKKDIKVPPLKIVSNTKPFEKTTIKSLEKPKAIDTSKKKENTIKVEPSKSDTKKEIILKKKTKIPLRKKEISPAQFKPKSPEISPYRHSNKLDLQRSDGCDRNLPNEMSTSYFYPKPISNSRTPTGNDRMAQSLIFERSLASMIFAGSLDRANPNYFYHHPEFPETLESKSMSAPKPLNSFSQDSLDGNKSKKRNQKNNYNHYNKMYKDLDDDELSDHSSTMNQIEDDEFKVMCTHYSGIHSDSNYLIDNYWDSTPIRDDVDQYNIDQLMKPSISMKDLSSFSQSGRNSPISIHNEFISNRDHSIIGKDDDTLLNDLASKCIVSIDHNQVQIIVTEDPRSESINEYGYVPGRNDPVLLETIASKCIFSTDQKYDRIPISEEEYLTEISQLNSPYDLEKSDYISENENEMRLNDNFDDDIPNKTLKLTRGQDTITITIEEEKELRKSYEYDQFKQDLGSEDHFAIDPNQDQGENGIDSIWKRSMDQDYDFRFQNYNNHYNPEENESIKDNNIDFDRSFCKIIMTDENLTGIKNPHDHINGTLPVEYDHFPFPKHHTVKEDNFTKPESTSRPNMRPSSPYHCEFTKKMDDHFMNKIKSTNESSTFDKDGKRIIITNDNLTGIKSIDEENYDQNEKHERPSISFGTDQYCNQIFIPRQNYAMIQKELSPVDRENSMKNIILNNPPLQILIDKDQYFDSKMMKSQNDIREHLTYNQNQFQTGRSFFAALNAQNNDNMYNDHRNTSNPNIEINGDEDVTDGSSINELSWSDFEGNRSCTDYMDNSMAMHSTPWISSPDLRSTHYNFPSRHLQSENPLKPLCSICHQPAYFMERISVSNIIFHKTCFRCRKCDTHLNLNNCIIYRNRPYCVVHMRAKVRRSVRSASSKKLNQIKERLDNKSNLQKQSSNEVKQQKRIFYEGINSAKTKFLDDATKVKEIPIREPKRITPPRQGFNSGVVESDPKPRDPNIVAYSDGQTNYLEEVNLLTQNSSAKENRARFKELQRRSSGSKDFANGEEDGLSRRPDVIPVDTKSLRDRFIANANDSEIKVKKINPSDEIRRFSEQESNSIYENDPEQRTGVVNAETSKEEETVSPMSRIRAKEMKEKFSNFSQNEQPKKTEVKLEYGEGGVYESNPQENNDDVVKYNYDTKVYLPENTVKSGLQRIKELQDQKSQGFQKTNKEPIKLENDPNQCGIYENTPEKSRADSISYQNNSNLSEFREKNYANEAKKVLLEKQKQDEATTKKSPPSMIDIWKDLCPDSGIFENEPQKQREDVVKHDSDKYELVVKNDKDSVNVTEKISVKKDIEGNNVQEAH